MTATSLRLFFAVFPDHDGRAGLSAWQAALLPLYGGRTVPDRNLHLTLAFLGQVAHGQLGQLEQLARHIRGEPFDLCINAVHYWPHNRIVYAAPSVIPPGLINLVNALEQPLSAIRIDRDQSPYAPHITLLRRAHPATMPAPVLPGVCWKVRHFALVHSPGSGGIYQILEKFPLE